MQFLSRKIVFSHFLHARSIPLLFLLSDIAVIFRLLGMHHYLCLMLKLCRWTNLTVEEMDPGRMIGKGASPVNSGALEGAMSHVSVAYYPQCHMSTEYVPCFYIFILHVANRYVTCRI